MTSRQIYAQELQCLDLDAVLLVLELLMEEIRHAVDLPLDQLELLFVLGLLFGRIRALEFAPLNGLVNHLVLHHHRIVRPQELVSDPEGRRVLHGQDPAFGGGNPGGGNPLVDDHRTHLKWIQDLKIKELQIPILQVF